MKLGLIFKNAVSTVKMAAENGAILTKKHAPEILLVTAAAGIVVTVVETVKATNKTNDILDHKEYRKEIVQAIDDPAYTDEDYARDIANINKQAKWELVKAWFPVVTTTGTSLICMLCGFKIINGRYVATAAAYKTLEAGFERYRSNVIEEFGRDVDWRMAHTVKAEELAEERQRQDKLRETTKKRRVPRTQYSKDINNQIFDCHSSERWKKFWIPAQVIGFVNRVEEQLQDKVNSDGFALLNDAYDMLGMPRTTQGAIIGWIKTPRNKHDQPGTYVSLGFANDETPREEIERIHSSETNETTWLWITPNCDGVIYQKIDVPFSER